MRAQNHFDVFDLDRRSANDRPYLPEHLVAQKLADNCNNLSDGESIIDALVSCGVHPAQVDLHRLDAIREAASNLRRSGAKSSAIACIVIGATSLIGLAFMAPAHAADGAPLSAEAGGWALFGVSIVGVLAAIFWPDSPARENPASENESWRDLIQRLNEEEGQAQ